MFVQDQKRARAALGVLALLALMAPSLTWAATMYLTPASGTFEVGERIMVQALVSGDVSLNAASAMISVPPDLLAIESVSKASSILNFWVADPSFSRAAGTAQFEGVSLSGFQGSRGILVSLTLKALAPGTASVSISYGQILANDGQGTDITGTKSGASFTIVPASAKPVPVAPKPEIKPAPKVEKPVPAITIVRRDAPDIFLGTKDGKQAILGTTGSAHTNVLVGFVSSDDAKVYISGTTDGLGSFTLPVPPALRSGLYAVNAFTVFDDGKQSEASNTITVDIGTVIYGEFTWKGAAYLLLGLVVFFAACLAYVLVRRHVVGDLTPHSLRRQVRDTERVTQKAFSILRQDVSNQRKSARRDKAKASELLDIEQDLDDAEKMIEEKLKNIGEKDR